MIDRRLFAPMSLGEWLQQSYDCSIWIYGPFAISQYDGYSHSFVYLQPDGTKIEAYGDLALTPDGNYYELSYQPYGKPREIVARLHTGLLGNVI